MAILRLLDVVNMIKNKDGSISFKNKTELKNYVKDKESLAISQYRKQVHDVAVKDVAKDASRNVTLMVYESLHLEYGFGKKRLQQFTDRYNEIVDCYDKGLIEFEDLEKEYSELLPEDYEIVED